MHDKFEYMSLVFDNTVMLDNGMTEFGQFGWEAYSVITYSSSVIKVFFKRKIN